MASREVDLTSEPVPAVDQAQFKAKASREVQYVARSQEKTRRYIAYALLGLLIALSIAGVDAMFIESLQLQRVKDIMGIIFTSVVGLVGSVARFYFGARTAESVTNPGEQST